MKKLRITATFLIENLEACRSGVERFREQYPRGVVVTDDQEANFPIIVEALARGANVGFLAESLYVYDDSRPPYLADPMNGLLWGDDEYIADSVAEHHACGAEFGYAGFLADAVGVYLSKHPKAAYRGKGR
jgi:hypothetical protein